MIWLASYPRSGNTFLRNILYEVYSLESTDYNSTTHDPDNKSWHNIPVIKTHLLPRQLPATEKSYKYVYIIRDGRDATVSLSHHRKDIKKVTQNKMIGYIDIIFGWGNTFKTSWSGHVKAWEKEADIIIKFEDLIKDPIKEVEKLRAIIDLPKPNLEKLPTFADQKSGKTKYGADKDKNSDTKDADENFSSFFRSGKVGAFRNEMPALIRFLFWILNSKTLKKYYSK